MNYTFNFKAFNNQTKRISIPNTTKIEVQMPATCKICNKSYKRYESGIEHVHHHHGMENPKNYVNGTIGVCMYEDCTFTTMRTGNFIKHIKKVHLKVCL